MTTKAIEAGARAICQEAYGHTDLTNTDEGAYAFRGRAKACIEAAIASGELVPASKALPYNSAEFLTTPESLEAYTKEVVASAVAAERERCLRAARASLDLSDAMAAIRALEPASVEYVLVPKVATKAILSVMSGCEDGSADMTMQEAWTAMLTAATSNGSGK